MRSRQMCKQCHEFFDGPSYGIWSATCPNCHYLLQSGRIEKRRTTVWDVIGFIFFSILALLFLGWLISHGVN